MTELSSTLGQVLQRPSWLPVPEFVVKVALGELGSLMTTGQRVHPGKAIASGFVFQYPTLEPALWAILKK
jgi:NAD dependent epimerase/dehydratase family enzyme